MIHGMQPLLLPQRGVLRWVEEACEVVVEARRDHAGATEDPVKRTGMHAQPLLPEEERDRAAASQGDDVLEGLRCLGKPRAEAAGLLLRGQTSAPLGFCSAAWAHAWPRLLAARDKLRRMHVGW